MRFNQEHSYQDLNGITDWFQDAVDYTSDKVSDAALWATEATGTTQDALALTEQIDDQVNQLSAGFKSKINEFRTMMAKLFETQNKVDEAIESLPDGAEKQRLMAKRDESRGKFMTFIMPAWNKFQDWMGEGDYAGMGLAITGTMVATAGAVVAAISIALPYIYSNYKLEQQILNDPALAKTYVATRGSLFSLGNLPVYVGLGIAGIGGIYLLSKFSK